MASSSGCAPREGVGSLPGAAEKDESGSPPEVPSLDQRFSRQYRLTVRRQFLAVYGGGSRVSSSSFTLFGLPNDTDSCRLGLTVSRRVGKASRRNRTKRVLRDVFRSHRSKLQPPLDLVINARPGIHERSSTEIESEFLDSFRKLAARVEKRA